MDRYTKKDFESITAQLTTNARLCGMLEPTEVVYLNRGSTSNGIAAYVQVLNRDEGTQRVPYWLPRFGYKDTPRVQYKALAASADALRGAFDVIKRLTDELPTAYPPAL